MANTTSNMGLSATGVSGVLGLAFPSDAAISSTLGRTLLENVFAHLDPADRFFSYKLSAEGNDSTFSIGEIDPAYAEQASDIFYSPVYSSDGADYDYWKLPLQAITVNGAAIPFALSPSKVSGATSPIAVLDTGTTLILGPTHDVDNFWTVVGGAQKGDDGRWVVRCNHVISVGLVLGNDTVHREIPLDPSDVSWWPPGSSSDGWCLGGIQSNDGVSLGRFFSFPSSSHFFSVSSAIPLRSMKSDLINLGPGFRVGVLRRLAFWRCIFEGKSRCLLVTIPHTDYHIHLLFFPVTPIRAFTSCIRRIRQFPHHLSDY